MWIEKHPVGFRKYILLAVLGYRLRVHVWPDGSGNDSRHNHRWWFVSIPVVGHFIETRYREHAGDSYLRINVLDEDGVRDSGRRYTASGESELETIVRRIRRPMRPYYCPLGAIHSLVPRTPGRFHASIVICGRLQRDISEIWRHQGAVDVPLDNAD